MFWSFLAFRARKNPGDRDKAYQQGADQGIDPDIGHVKFCLSGTSCLLLALDKPVGDGTGLKSRGVGIDVESCLECSSFGCIVEVGIHGGSPSLSGFRRGYPAILVDGDFDDHGTLFTAGVVGFGVEVAFLPERL